MCGSVALALYDLNKIFYNIMIAINRIERLIEWVGLLSDVWCYPAKWDEEPGVGERQFLACLP